MYQKHITICNLYYELKFKQGCALAEPGVPWRLTLICSWVTRKSEIFHTNHMLGSLDFTGAEDWAPFNVPWSTALANTKTYRLHSNFICIKFKSQVLN